MRSKRKSRRPAEAKNTIIDIHRRCARERSLSFFEHLFDYRYEQQFQNSRERLSIERSFLPVAIPIALTVLTWATTVFIEPPQAGAFVNSTDPASDAAIWWLTQSPSLMAGSSMELNSTRLYIACFASALLFGTTILVIGLRDHSNWVLTWIAAAFCFTSHLCALVGCALVRGRGPMAYCSSVAMICTSVSISQAPFSSRINALMILLSIITYFTADRIDGGPIQWQAIICIVGVTTQAVFTGEWKQREQRSAFVDALVAAVAYDLAERDARQHAAVLSAAVPAPLQRRFFKMKVSVGNVVDVRLCNGAVVLAFRFDRVEEEIARRMKLIGKGLTANDNFTSFSSNRVQPQLAACHANSYPISPMLVVQSILRKLERSVELVSNWYFALTGTTVRQILSRTTPLDTFGSESRRKAARRQQKKQRSPKDDEEAAEATGSAEDTGTEDTITPKVNSLRHQAVTAAAAEAPLSLFRVFGDTAFVCGPLGRSGLAQQEGMGGLQESAAMSAMYLLLRFLSAVRSSAPAVRIGCGVAGGQVMSAMSRGDLPSCEVYGSPMITAKAILVARIGGAQPGTLPFSQPSTNTSASNNPRAKPLTAPSHVVGMTADCVDSALNGKRRWIESTARNNGPLEEGWTTQPETAEDAAHRKRLFEEATARRQDAYAELNKLRKRCRGEAPKVMHLPEGDVVVVPVKFVLDDPHQGKDASKSTGLTDSSLPESPNDQDEEDTQPILSPVQMAPAAQSSTFNIPETPPGSNQPPSQPNTLPPSILASPADHFQYSQSAVSPEATGKRLPMALPLPIAAKDEPSPGRFIDFVNM
eukprot:GILI01009981.1.p1 GENE.GILI01009981.1~~GILI01009981.1.p1  ORF type:complete len:961 (+),score=156.93 GILI01009981.1:434-2884(+)